MKLFELQDRPEQEKNFDRNTMPQIRKGNLQNSPFKFKKGKINLDKLKPVQSQRVKGYHDKAKSGFADGSIRPIVIDKNNYIVNGHHRYDVACGLELKKVRVIKVEATIEELIEYFSETAEKEPTYEEKMKAKVDSLVETIENTIYAKCELEHIVDGVDKGNFLFKQEPGKPVLVVGRVTGLTPGKHGFHIHEFGDLSNGCESAGPHYNPDDVDHGDLDSGHAGDLGNIVADKNGIAKIGIVLKRVDLHGDRNIVGRAIVVHADEDDLGKGGDEESAKTGNAGERLGCGVIRLATLNETIEASQDISALMKGIEADLKQRKKDLKRLPKKSVYEAPIIRPQGSYEPDANDAYNHATNRKAPKYNYDPEIDYRPGKSLGKIPNIQSETEVVQMPNGDLYLFYANSMSGSSRETPKQKSMWEKFIKAILHNPKANQTGPNKEKNVLGFLKLKPFEDGYRVAGVGMDPEIRGQGKAIKFYLAFSAWKGVPIYSDFSQTPSAKTMWSSIIGRYPKRVVAYDQKNKKDIPLAKAGDMYQDQPDGFDDMSQFKAAKVLGGTKLFKLLPEGEVIHKNFGRDQSIEKQINPGEPQKAYDAYDGDYLPYYFSNGMELTLMDEEYSNGEHEVWVLNDANGKEIERGEKQSDLVSTLQDMTQIPIQENFKDGKKKGKSRPGRVKKSGASCNGSVTSLRKKAKNSSGEKSKMYHWCANMKAGRKKK